MDRGSRVDFGTPEVEHVRALKVLPQLCTSVDYLGSNNMSSSVTWLINKRIQVGFSPVIKGVLLDVMIFMHSCDRLGPLTHHVEDMKKE